MSDRGGKKIISVLLLFVTLILISSYFSHHHKFARVALGPSKGGYIELAIIRPSNDDNNDNDNLPTRSKGAALNTLVGKSYYNYANQSAVIHCSKVHPKGMTPKPCYYGMTFLRRFSSSLLVSSGVPFVALGLNGWLTGVTALTRARGGLYASIIVFRSVWLYMGLNTLQTYWLTSREDDTCLSYQHLRPCVPVFDFADHVILYLTHYTSISAFEGYSMLQSGPYAGKAVVYAWLGLLNLIVGYLIFHTTFSFHTTGENLVALLIVILLIWVPLRWLATTKGRLFIPRARSNSDHFL